MINYEKLKQEKLQEILNEEEKSLVNMFKKIPKDLFECRHESDGNVYELQPEYQCIICGEFYR